MQLLTAFPALSLLSKHHQSVKTVVPNTLPQSSSASVNINSNNHPDTFQRTIPPSVSIRSGARMEINLAPLLNDSSLLTTLPKIETLVTNGVIVNAISITGLYTQIAKPFIQKHALEKQFNPNASLPMEAMVHTLIDHLVTASPLNALTTLGESEEATHQLIENVLLDENAPYKNALLTAWNDRRQTVLETYKQDKETRSISYTQARQKVTENRLVTWAITPLIMEINRKLNYAVAKNFNYYKQEVPLTGNIITQLPLRLVRYNGEKQTLTIEEHLLSQLNEVPKTYQKDTTFSSLAGDTMHLRSTIPINPEAISPESKREGMALQAERDELLTEITTNYFPALPTTITPTGELTFDEMDSVVIHDLFNH